jgi:dihydrodipicolinate synthase/N-acetylneuraminate lyase
LTADGELDEDALARHVSRICGPADCAVAMGAIAEVDYLTDVEWQQCVRIASATVPSTAPLIIGLPTGADRAERLASDIDRSAGIAVLAPLGPADATQHVLTLADRSRRPVIPPPSLRARRYAAPRGAH